VVMKYVAQEHPLGCFLAATAMVLDMTYEQVSEKVPLQDPKALQKTGINILGLVALEEVEKLARSCNRAFAYPVPPFVCKAGFRYIGVLPIRKQETHAVAIDESGVVFDPDSNALSGKNWAELVFSGGMLEFQPSHSSGI